MSKALCGNGELSSIYVHAKEVEALGNTMSTICILKMLRVRELAISLHQLLFVSISSLASSRMFAKNGGQKQEGDDRIFKWLAVGTEIPIMVFLGAFLGYVSGKRLGPPYEFVLLTLGAFLGFIVSVIPLFRETKRSGKRKSSR